MRWRDREGSVNVEDRRSLPNRAGRSFSMGLVGVVIVFVVSAVFNVSPISVLNLLSNVQAPLAAEQGGPLVSDAKGDEQAQFVSVVLADTERVWGKVFATQGQAYVAPKLVLFRDATSTGCGKGEAAMGPFYCPPDQTIYIDLGAVVDKG